ncbi:hypothetical protein HII31_03752 [Pseudocercospora fuligena]|uniref:Uncharacterized protein n=1 Tax=Pseudocercospora fuligena TaxID=685502 RepID=A0A8H6VQ89_9PEZI|nr:hypothetical protein HII31_03752 [Pseudocercospora fuligena]
MPSPYKERRRMHPCPVQGCDFTAAYPKDLQKHLAKGQAERDQKGDDYKLTECEACGKKWCTRGCKPKHQCGPDEEEDEEAKEEERQRRQSKYLEEFNKKFGGASQIYLDETGQRKTKLTAEEQAEFVREFNKHYGHRNATAQRPAAPRDTHASSAAGQNVDAIIEHQVQHEIARGLRASNARPAAFGGKVVLSAEERATFVREFNAMYGHQNATATNRPTVRQRGPPGGEREVNVDAIIEGQLQHERALGLNGSGSRQGAVGGKPPQRDVPAGHTQSSPHVLDGLNADIAAQQHHEFVRGFYARHGQHASAANTTPPQQKSSRARQSLNVTGIDGSGLLADPFVDPVPSRNASAHATPPQLSSSRRRKRGAEDEVRSDQEDLTPASKRSYSGVPYEQRKFMCPNTPCEYAANKKHTLEGHQKAALKETAERGGQTHVPCTHCGKQFCTFSAARRHDCDAPQAQIERAGEVVESQAAHEASSNNDRKPIFISDAELDEAIAQYDNQLFSSPSPSKPPMDHQIHHQDPLFPHLRSPSPYIKPESTPEPPLPGPDRVMPSSSFHKPLALGPSSDTGHWVYDALEKDWPLVSSELMAQMVYSVEIGPLQYVWPSDVVYLRKLPRLAELGKNIELVWEEGEFDESRRSERDVLIRGRLRHWGMEREQVRVKEELVDSGQMGEKEADEYVWGEEFVAKLYERAHKGELDPSVKEAEEWFAEELRAHEESGKGAVQGWKK